MTKKNTELEQFKYRNHLSFSSKLARLIWNVVWALLFRPTPSWCLDRWRIGLLRLFGARIGKGCRVASSCRVWAPWNLRMGSLVCLGASVDCYSVSPIILGDKVAVSQKSTLCTASHNIKSLQRPLIHKAIVIEDHAWICAEAFIGPGVTIREGAVLGARGVVFKDVDAWAVMAGNPAVFVKTRTIDEDENGRDHG